MVHGTFRGWGEKTDTFDCHSRVLLAQRMFIRNVATTAMKR